MKKAEDDLIKEMASGFLQFLEDNDQDQTEQVIHEELNSILDDLFPDEDTKAKARELFIEAVNNKKSQLSEGIAKLLGGYLPLIENFDAVEALTDRIAELKNAISEVEQESYALASQQVSKLSEQTGLNEATIEALWNNSSSYEDLESKCQQAAKSERPVRRSTVEYFLEELNEDPNWANGGAEPYIDPQMKKYLSYLK